MFKKGISLHSCLFVLVFLFFGMVVGCSDSSDRSPLSISEDRENFRRSFNLRGSSLEEADLTGETVDLEMPGEAADKQAEPENVLRYLDSALASGDEGEVMDQMLDFEDQGGPTAVSAFALVIDRSSSNDLKLDAIAGLSMFEGEADVREPLLRAMDDPSLEIRLEALDVLAESSFTGLIPILKLRSKRATEPEMLEALEDAIEELQFIKEAEESELD